MKIRLNAKHILFHFLGLWMFGHAFKVFAFLSNVDAAETIRLSKSETARLTAESLSKLTVSLAIAFFIGYLVALCLSFIASSKIKGSYINTVISFIIFYSLLWLHWTGWSYLKTVFFLPGSLFSGSLYYITTAVILLALGLFFIFRIKGFDSNKKDEQTPSLPQYA
jgi:hypothetical protein